MLTRSIIKLKQYLTPLTLSLAAFLVIIVGFLVLVDDVGEGGLLRFDQVILELINTTATDTLDNFFVALTTFGGELAIALTTAGIVGLLLARRRIRDALIIGGTVVGATVSVYLLKLLFARPRPDLWQTFVSEPTYSFPSGHAIASSALALSLMVVAWSSRWRWLVVAVGSVYIALIGYSRLYLGVHYPTDIIASWLLSGVWLISVYQVIARVQQHRRRINARQHG